MILSSLTPTKKEKALSFSLFVFSCFSFSLRLAYPRLAYRLRIFPTDASEADMGGYDLRIALERDSDAISRLQL